MSENNFPWNGDETVCKAFKAENYKILHTHAKAKKAIVFFSSNGIYFPNTIEVFSDVILKENYYEWENISKNEKIQNHFSKIIFVRDIYKQWYLGGINEHLNTQDKVTEFLKNETEGYDTVVCGSSAGGYMALLSGLEIGARKIFSFSAQFNIENEPVAIRAIKDLNIPSPNLSLLKYIKPDNCASIFYFCPAFSKMDTEQYDLVKEMGLNVFMIGEKAHGIAIGGKCLPYLLIKDKEKLSHLSKKFKGKIIKNKVFSRKIIPLYERIKMFLNKKRFK